MTLDIYNRAGEPISVEEWARLSSDHDYKIVQQTAIDDQYMVSTVWLGLDHQWGNGPPIIFETMVFPMAHWKGDVTEWSELLGREMRAMEEQDSDRYCTEVEAICGHARMVMEWQRKAEEEWKRSD